MKNVTFEGGSLETLRALLDRTGGCTVVPKTYARTLPASVRLPQVRPFADAVPTREVSLVARRAQWKTDIVRALATSLREHAPRSLPRDLADGTMLPIRCLVATPGGCSRRFAAESPA